ncbi:hypothetical protein ACBI99_19160 [Nonomuraea sp. ATR24]|uniref:hypothetical protein n=1 Tax=unclassified Nonomuraea TaxID=2593643 RepID=UPI0033D9E0DB
MRPTIVLLGTTAVMDAIAARLKSYGTYEEKDIFDRLSAGDCLFNIDLSGDVLDDYDDGELQDLAISSEDLGAILIEYQSVSCIRKLVLTVISEQDGFLDTNHGRIIAFDEVRNRFDREPDWDWRRSTRSSKRS